MAVSPVISLGLVREPLSPRVAQGLIIIVPRRGVVVKELSVEEFLSLSLKDLKRLVALRSGMKCASRPLSSGHPEYDRRADADCTLGSPQPTSARRKGSLSKLSEPNSDPGWLRVSLGQEHMSGSRRLVLTASPVAVD
jgi:hypothetical protein